MKTTNRMLALARAIERLSARDMVRVVEIVHEDRAKMFDSDRFRLQHKLLKIAALASPQAPVSPDEGEGR